MANHWGVVLFAVLGFAGCSPGNKTGANQAADSISADHYNFSPVTEKIQAWVDKGYYSGASMLVAKDGQVILLMEMGIPFFG